MARVIWKGAIVFGLVHIPVDLYSGAREQPRLRLARQAQYGARRV